MDKQYFSMWIGLARVLHDLCHSSMTLATCIHDSTMAIDVEVDAVEVGVRRKRRGGERGGGDGGGGTVVDMCKRVRENTHVEGDGGFMRSHVGQFDHSPCCGTSPEG